MTPHEKLFGKCLNISHLHVFRYVWFGHGFYPFFEKLDKKSVRCMFLSNDEAKNLEMYRSQDNKNLCLHICFLMRILLGGFLIGLIFLSVILEWLLLRTAFLERMLLTQKLVNLLLLLLFFSNIFFFSSMVESFFFFLSTLCTHKSLWKIGIYVLNSKKNEHIYHQRRRRHKII